MTRILRLVAWPAPAVSTRVVDVARALRDQDGFEAKDLVPAQVRARYASYADLLGQAVDAQG